MQWKITYPNGKRKALTFSYDDGRIHDRKLVAIFNRYGMKGTFHLNSGKLDTPDYINSAEVHSLYKGHEISCHGVEHLWLNQHPKESLVHEIWEDRRALERLAGYPVFGMSYAYGAYTDSVVKLIKSLGIQYSRTVNATKQFNVPSDYFRWNPTCHHNDNISELSDEFLRQPPSRSLSLFYIWGHSYEFNNENNWGILEGFCEKTSNNPEIWYPTNIEYMKYMTAVTNLVTGVDGNMIYNPSGSTVFIEKDGKIIQIPAGHTVHLS